MSTNTLPLVEYALATVKGEFTRRKNNKRRDKKVRAKSWQLAKLSKSDLPTLEAGGEVIVEGQNAGQVRVALKKAA